MSSSADLSNEPRAGRSSSHQERRENDDDEFDDALESLGNDSDSERHDLPSILAYLIRR